jgi:hypothetical protein
MNNQFVALPFGGQGGAMLMTLRPVAIEFMKSKPRHTLFNGIRPSSGVASCENPKNRQRF